jgi:4-hydroxyphenylpyruvate dioxygenase
VRASGGTEETTVRTSIATVCVSGSLAEKLQACATAGFDGVEVFEPDLVASEQSPEEIRALSGRLGLSLDLYQPFRDFEGIDDDLLADNLRRAETKFRLMQRLGMDLMLVCSNVATATIDSDEVSASQLRRLGDLAASYDVRIAFEALAWGRYIDDYRRSWRVVQQADHPAVGLCLDSFHILSRGHDPAAIEDIPGDRIFFLQMADAPTLSMDVLSWSRHHRLFPGEGSFELAGFLAHVLRAGYPGPLSLEIFNDTFRQTDVDRTAVHALRSLRWLEDQASRALGDTAADLTRLTDAEPPVGFDFVEVKAEDTSEYDAVLRQLGFRFRGLHRTKPVRLWTSGQARVVLNEQHARDQQPHLAAVGFDVQDVPAATARAQALMAPPVYRSTYASELAIDAVSAPDATEIFLCGPAVDGEAPWVAEFKDGESPLDAELVTGIDHVSLVQPWQYFDEAILFYTSILRLDTASTSEVAGPFGLVRSQVMRTPDRCIRLPLSVAPPILDSPGDVPQHVAFSCTDVVELARRARERGLRFLSIPDNYYDDLSARFGLEEATISQLRELDLLYDRDGDGEFVHFYTLTIGELFLEFVERRRGYDGYGVGNAPVRLAAQRRG